MKKILIIGGTGYLGFNIAANLCSNYAVTVVGKKPLKSDLLNFFHDKNIVFEQVDIINLNKIFRLIERNDHIIFAVPNIQPHQVKPLFHSDLLRILIPAKKIFKYSSNLNKRIIFLSSGGSVYGAESLNPHTETTTPIPVTKYGKYKLSLDNNLLNLNSKCSSKHVILRISNPYGGTFNNVYRQGFINSLVRTIKTKGAVEIWGDGYQIRDFIYIQDLVNLVTEILKKEDTQGVFNCGSGSGHSLRQVVQIAEDILESRIEVKFIESYEEKIKSNILNIEKTVNHFDWAPTFELKTTLNKLLIS
jgi:UDP-glucose 4-epimerase